MQNSYIYPIINVEIYEQQGLDKNVKTGIKTKVKVATDLIILKLIYTTSNSSQPLKLFVVTNFRCPFMGQKVSLAFYGVKN